MARFTACVAFTWASHAMRQAHRERHQPTLVCGSCAPLGADAFLGALQPLLRPTVLCLRTHLGDPSACDMACAAIWNLAFSRLAAIPPSILASLRFGWAGEERGGNRDYVHGKHATFPLAPLSPHVPCLCTGMVRRRTASARCLGISHGRENTRDRGPPPCSRRRTWRWPQSCVPKHSATSLPQFVSLSLHDCVVQSGPSLSSLTPSLSSHLTPLSCQRSTVLPLRMRAPSVH